MKWSFSALDPSQAHRTREELVRTLKLRCGEEDDYDACEIIYAELIGNVVRHAPGPVQIMLDWNGDDPVLSVVDHGPAFSFNANPPANPLAETGRGLYLVAQLANRINVQPIAKNGKAVRVVLPVRPR